MCDYMINHNENEDENKKQMRRCGISRPRSRHGHKCSKF